MKYVKICTIQNWFQIVVVVRVVLVHEIVVSIFQSSQHEVCPKCLGGSVKHPSLPLSMEIGSWIVHMHIMFTRSPGPFTPEQ